MAIYHYSAQILTRSKGQSAVAAAAYRAGEVLHDRRLGVTNNYTHKKEVIHTQILAPQNAPDWIYNREELWNQVEAAEKRKDSQVAREINVALPKELTLEPCLDLLRGFCQKQFVNLGMVVDVAVHWLDKNPHAHIMLTTRSLDSESGQFGQKNRDWNCKDLLEAQRKAWADHVNQALEKAAAQARVDHRSLEDQGITDRLPQIHLGRILGLLKRKRRQELLSHPRMQRYQEISRTNAVIAQLKEEIAQEEHLLAIGSEILPIADLALSYAKAEKLEGQHYQFDRNSITAKDGRGVLVSREGDLLVVSEQLTEADREFFRTQQKKLQQLQRQSQRQEHPGKESLG